MARIEGIDLPRNKRVEIGLTYIYGIGRTRAKNILAATNVSPDQRIQDLSESDLAALREFINKNYKLEGDLRRETQMNIKRLIEAHFFDESGLDLRRRARPKRNCNRIARDKVDHHEKRKNHE